MSSNHPRLHTRICDLFQIKYPIVQTGMGWVSTARLTAATSAAGGIGFLATATQTFDEMKESVVQIQSSVKFSTLLLLCACGGAQQVTNTTYTVSTGNQTY